MDAGAGLTCICPTGIISSSVVLHFCSIFSWKPHTLLSHLTGRPHHDTHDRLVAKSVRQKTLITLCVRTLNCNKFMDAAAPLLENEFYLLIN